MRRHELSDARWELIAALLPLSGRRGGGRWRDHRQGVNGLMWKARHRRQWRDLPERHGPWRTVYERCVRGRREGVFDRLLDRLRLRLNAEGLIDLDLRCIGSTSVRASRSAAGAGKKGIQKEPDDHALGLSRGGMGPKIHLVTDGAGLPLTFTLAARQRHALTAFERTLKAVRLPGLRGRPRTRPKPLAGDKAYSYRPVVAYLRRRRIRPVIPPRKGGSMGQGWPASLRS